MDIYGHLWRFMDIYGHLWMDFWWSPYIGATSDGLLAIPYGHDGGLGPIIWTTSSRGVRSRAYFLKCGSVARNWSFWWSPCIGATSDGLLAIPYGHDGGLGPIIWTTSSRGVRS